MNEELDPQKYHVLTKKQTKKVIVLLLGVAMVVLPFSAYLYYSTAVSRPAQNFEESTISIEEGETVNEIINDMYAHDLINSKFLMKLYLVLNSNARNIQAGVYTIPAGTNLTDLISILQHGTNDISITYLEGWRVEEMALHSAENFSKVDFEDFVRMAKGDEGMLFPDTYFFNAEVSEKDIVERMKANYENRVDQVLTPEALEEVGLTEQQVLIFASMVEREVNKPEDRPVVAGILIKRWQNEELIGADATTQYAIATDSACIVAADQRDGEVYCIPTKEEAREIDWWPQALTVADLDNPSPYNTRENVGLPPAPIANPGLNAIQSVLNYQETPYNYYLNDSEGTTHYAETLEQHNINVARYL